MVSMDQEFNGVLVEWFWPRIFHEVTTKMLARAGVI